MRNNTFYKILIAFFAVLMITAACEKEDQVMLSPKVATWEITDITSTSANLSGFVIAQGSGFSEYGVCWSENNDLPTIDDTKQMVDSIHGAVYKTTVTGLEHLTKYFVRAYVIAIGGEVLYGEDTNFTTLAHLPTIVVTAPTKISYNSAVVAADVTYDGKSPVTARGIVWGLYANPTLEDNKTKNGEGTGAFSDTVTGLVADSVYYVRAYATNAIGTTYSDEFSFKTLAGPASVITIDAVAQETTAQVRGTITYDGGADILERGVVWSTSENPTLADNSGTATGDTFQVDIIGLTSNTTYHARAYATNSAGTSYGADISFATYPAELYMTGNGVGLDAEDWNWHEPLQLIPVHSHPEMFWKIVWMKGNSGEFKLAPQAAWDGDFGKTGDATNGVYQKGGDNIPVPATAGYYMVVVDLAKNTIEIAEPKVYGIGNAFGGSWTAYDPNYLFTVDNTNEVIYFNSVPDTDNLRMHVQASTLNCDWWQAEFNIISGNIEFRGTGGDQTAVPVTSGDDVSLNFKLGTGTITTP